MARMIGMRRAAHVAASGFALVALCAATALLAQPAADTPPRSARELLTRAFASRYDVDVSSTIELVVRSRDGQERRRTLQALSKRIDDRVHSIGRLTGPEHLRGMTVLMIEAAEQRHDAFLYLPSLATVRRVTTAQRGDAFFGTDITYEDLERQRADAFDLGAIGSGERAGEPVYLIDARPRRRGNYERVRFALATSDLAILEAEYFKRNAEQAYRVIRVPRETLIAQDGHVLPTRILVESRDRGTTTEVRLGDLRINPKIDARLFSVKTLQSRRPLPMQRD